MNTDFGMDYKSKYNIDKCRHYVDIIHEDQLFGDEDKLFTVSRYIVHQEQDINIDHINLFLMGSLEDITYLNKFKEANKFDLNYALSSKGFSLSSDIKSGFEQFVKLIETHINNFNLNVKNLLINLYIDVDIDFCFILNYLPEDFKKYNYKVYVTDIINPSGFTELSLKDYFVKEKLSIPPEYRLGGNIVLPVDEFLKLLNITNSIGGDKYLSLTKYDYSDDES